MKVALAASEVVPFSKTGGLADVCGALPRVLEKLGASVSVFTPYYRAAKAVAGPVTPGPKFKVRVGDREVAGAAFRSALPGSGVPVWFVGQDEYFDRDGLYGTSAGDHADNASRFVFFCRAVLEILRATGEKPDVFHVHDWQSALVPIYLHTLYASDFPRASSVITIHNLAYQGMFWHWDMKLTGLDWKHFHWQEMEYYGKVNFLKTGMVHADAITTVSPTYAKEIQTPEAGCGLDGVLRHRSDVLHGILNGIDTAEWDPSADPHLPAKYSAKSAAGKAKCKAALQKEVGLPERGDVPLFGVIGRLAEQKGVDLLVPAVRALLAEEDVQFVVLGAGDAAYQKAVEDLGRQKPDRIAVRIQFDNALAHRIEAGSDVFLMPSRYEPCGLNQIYSLRYGTIPVVRSTGGLADTVVDGRTGFAFRDYTVDAFLGALRRALELYRNPKGWKSMMREGMVQDFSWEASAKKYLGLFEELRRGAARR